MQGGCQLSICLFYTLEVGERPEVCSFYRVESSCFLSCSGGGNVVDGRGDLGLDYDTIKCCCAQKPAMGDLEVAQRPAGGDRVPGPSVITRLKDVAGGSADHEHAVVFLIELDGDDVGESQRGDALPGIARISAAEKAAACSKPD